MQVAPAVAEDSALISWKSPVRVHALVVQLSLLVALTWPDAKIGDQESEVTKHTPWARSVREAVTISFSLLTLSHS